MQPSDFTAIDPWPTPVQRMQYQVLDFSLPSLLTFCTWLPAAIERLLSIKNFKFEWSKVQFTCWNDKITVQARAQTMLEGP